MEAVYAGADRPQGASQPGGSAQSGQRDGAGGEAHSSNAWHHRNAVFILNPSKLRMHPDKARAATGHSAAQFFQDWVK